MDLRRLRPAEWLLTFAGVLLLVSLFLPWFEVTTHVQPPTLVVFGTGFGQTLTAWQAFAVVDVVLALCALVGLLAVVFQVTQRSPALPIVTDAASTWAGLVATVLIVIKLIDAPTLDSGGVSFDVLSPSWGAWVGLAGALALAAGGWAAMHDERPGSVPATHLESPG